MSAKKAQTVLIHEVINGGGNCSIAGGVQLYLFGLRVGTPCRFKPVDVGFVGSENSVVSYMLQS